MRYKINIPEKVKDSISKHIYTSVAEAVEEYISGNEDEDTLTGDLGATLRTKSRKVKVEEGNYYGTWTWSITYYKFRGRGKNATENLIGADGIFELKLTNNGETSKKCVLFQAKNLWNSSDKSLLEQSIKLSNWREAAFILNYTPQNYETFFIDDVIKAKGAKPPVEIISLGDFLNRYFIECLIGDNELRYDAQLRRLYWKANNNELVSTKFSIRHKFSISINAPKRRRKYIPRNTEIENDEISNYRMNASLEEVLSLKEKPTKKEISQSRKQLMQIYHPDYFQGLDDFTQSILKRRAQEINQAHDLLIKQRK